jgi:hypothetical protein
VGLEFPSPANQPSAPVQGQTYRFPISIEDAKGATLFAEFKAITLMRWIRKAIDDKTFQPVKS